MEFDDVFDYIGHVGLYQILLLFMVGIIGLFQGYQNTAMNFLGPKMPHWCQVKRLENFTFDQQKYIAIPLEKSEETGKMIYSSCKRFDYNFSARSDMDLFRWNRSTANLNNTVSCNSWVYDKSVFASAATNEFNLVCGRSLLVQAGSTAYLAGFFVGAITSGAVSDKIGRKKAILIFNSIHFLCGTACAFSPNFPVFAVLRFLTGIGVTSCFTCGFVIFMEAIGPKVRMVMLICYHIWFALGFGLASGLSYAVRDFRKLQLVFALPALSVILFVFAVQESPRWLLYKGRKNEAISTLRKIAAINNRELPEKMDLTIPVNIEEENASVLDLFRTPNIRRKTLILFVNWITESMLFYGLSLNVGTLVGNLHLNSFLNAMVQVPANILSFFLLGRIGRRWTISGALIFSGLTSFGTIPLLNIAKLAPLRTTLSLLGKAGVSLSFAAVYIWTAEIYPTVIRNVGLGASSTSSRIAAMAAPYIGGPLGKVWLPLPSMIFGIFGVGAGLVSLFLPETLNKTLPESIEEAENFGMKSKIARRKGQFNIGFDGSTEKLPMAAGVFTSSQNHNYL